MNPQLLEKEIQDSKERLAALVQEGQKASTLHIEPLMSKVMNRS